MLPFCGGLKHWRPEGPPRPSSRCESRWQSRPAHQGDLSMKAMSPPGHGTGTCGFEEASPQVTGHIIAACCCTLRCLSLWRRVGKT
jgi:hypothetical protein